MNASAGKYRDFLNRVPGAPFVQREFGFYCLERWYREGLPRETNLDELFQFDPPGFHMISRLGGTEAELCPPFEEKLIEDRGEHEVIRDKAGRHVLFFKGRRDGFMPEYLSHPVTDVKTWEEKVKWRLDPASPARSAGRDALIRRAEDASRDGLVMIQHCIGGYMYLRSLIGPTNLLYFVHDQPELLHDCMETWFKLADAVIAEHQKTLDFDMLFFGEDICYNHGSLISPDMIREFLLPYYRQLLGNMNNRRRDRSRVIHFHVDSDGCVLPVIPLYRESGLDMMSPFEVAGGCDVVAIGRQFPELIMSGGFDKRILARGRSAIDAEAERIFPVMRARGGYLPTCDHGVPEEVSLDNYLHYRKRCLELGS